MEKIGRCWPADENRGSPASQSTRPRPAERKPTKDNSSMTARATRRISQPDSYHSAPHRSATTRATYSIPTLHSDTTACAASSTQAVSAMSLNSRHCARSRSATACAASSAQALNKRRAGTPPLPLAQLHPPKSSACRRPRPTERKPTKGQLKWLRKLRS